MMYKGLMGIAAAAAMFVVAQPAPAAAFAMRPTPGIQADQGNVLPAQWRGGHGRWAGRGWGGREYGWRRGYRNYPGPYAYAPYPYYRRNYAPGPYVRVGPLGFGFW